MASIDLPVISSMRASRSMNSTPSASATSGPMVDLPLPMKPTRTRLPANSAGGAQEGVEVSLHLADRIAAGLGLQRPRQRQRHHRLADDPGGGDDADVAALVVRLDLLLGGDVHRGQWLLQRRDRLEVAADDHRHAIGGTPRE